MKAHFPSAAAAVALIALGAAITSDAWADVIRLALRDDESSHVLLAPVAAIWLAVAYRARLRDLRPDRGLLGPAFVLVGWACYSAGDTCLWQSVWHAGAVLVAVGCLLTATGSAPLVRLLPAFVALLFLIPVPARLRQEISGPLGWVTAAATEQVLQFVGADVERSGHLLSIGGVEVAVAEACNGLRMFMALSLAGYTFAFLEPMGLARRIIVILGIPLLAVACNVIRLVWTVWLYGHQSPRLADTVHEISGWVMLLVSFALLVGLTHVLRKTEGLFARHLAAPQEAA